jgi:NADP-dependent 3-hydroxy acid dehydrogenase YdfG
MIDRNIKGYLYVIGKVIVLQCIFTLQVTLSIGTNSKRLRFPNLDFYTWEEIIDTNIKGYLSVIGKVVVRHTNAKDTGTVRIC